MSRQPDSYTGGTMPVGSAATSTGIPEASQPIWRQPTPNSGSQIGPTPPPSPQHPGRPSASWPSAKKSTLLGEAVVRFLAAVAIIAVALVIGIVAYFNSSPRLRAPHGTIGPSVTVGQQVDYVGFDDSGVIAVAEYRWLPGDDNTPAGHDVLAVHLRARVQRGPSYVPYVVRVITADGYRLDRTYVSGTGLERLFFEEYRRGATVDGWVFFELPRQDVTFLYSTHSEESLRLAIPGGPTPVRPEIGVPINQTVEFDSYDGHCQVTVHSARRTESTDGSDQPLLAVRLTVTSNQGACAWLIPKAIDAAGTEHADSFADAPNELIRLGSDWVYAGDVMRGWLVFEVDDQPLQLKLWDDVLVPIPKVG